MSKKKNSIIISIAVLLVVLAAVSVISYSIAGLGHGDETLSNTIAENSLTNLGDNLGDMAYMTNIDLIIDNAVNANEKYNIVEIVPNGVAASDLKKYVEDEGFSKYVLTAHKESATSDMPAKMINYNVLTLHAGVSLTDTYGSGTVQTLLDDADLIYISSPSYTSFDGTNNMSEELFNYLHVYALGSDKPIIMDYVTKNTTTGTTNKTYKDLVNTISRNHIKFRTYSWTQGLSAEDFFSSKGSYYLKYNVNSLSSRAPGTVLVVTKTNTPGADSMYGRMSSYGSDSVIKKAYYGLNSLLPTAMQYTIWNLSNGALTEAELNKGYDFILLENDIGSEILSEDVYKKLKSLSESSKYILYDARMVSTSSSGEEVASDANNYLKLMDMLISNKGVARYSHVLAISNGFFTSLDAQGADGTAGAKSIADIINAGDYRGSGSTGANGKKFRVLELQPCYPIDLEVAASKPNMTSSMVQSTFQMGGNYYEKPSEVLNGVTKDEVEDGTEYYPFELSKAKIAYATGLNMNQIQVDQMSTDELISKKETLLESYDLIYVGGNTSALTPHNYIVFEKDQNKDITNELLKHFTAFDMYTHTGVSVFLRVAPSKNRNMAASRLPYGNVDNTSGSTMVELNGNDITKRKLDEFTAYMKAGMPIIFESTVTEAFEKVKAATRLEQLSMRDIDPDSFMYDLLDAAYADKDKKNSIKWGLQATDRKDESGKNIIYTGEQMVDNSDKKYGNTLGDVTVFTDSVGADIKAVVNASNTRPALTLTDRPKDYIEGNANSYNDAGEKLSVTCTATLPGADTATIDLALYTDYNGDGIFSADELADSSSYGYNASATTPSSVTLTYNEMDEDFYGLISWKVVATAPSGACDIAKGYAYYPKKDDVEKKEVRILQIMPVYETNVAGENEDENDGHSLYFCTECQMAEYRAKYNIWCNGIDALAQNTIGEDESQQNVNLGLHEHKFGIVKFDSTIMDENWDSNLAESLMDDYDFELDIITIDEFEKVAKTVATQSEDDIEANKLAAQEHYANYLQLESELENGTVVADLEAELQKFVGDSNFVKSDRLAQYIADKEYYKFWLYNINRINVSTVCPDLRTAYNAYIAKKDKAIEEYNKYIEYTRISGDDETWMLNNFDVVVLGFAEDFGGKDLSLTACEQIKNYIAGGGSMLNTHDSSTRYKDVGAINLSNELRSAFGMDRFHVTGVSEGGAVSQTISFGFVNTAPGWDDKAFTFNIKDTDVNLNVYKNPYGDAAWAIESVKTEPVGDPHEDITENITINLTLTDYNGPVAGKDVGIWVWSNNTATGFRTAKTDANGKATLTFPQSNVPSGDIKYKEYATEDKSLYFWTERATNGDSTTLDNIQWMSYGYRSVVGVTDPMALYSSAELHSSPYLYVQYEFENATLWNQGYEIKKGYGTDGASQVNDGIVTTYPFTISSELRISGTHAQTLALDMEDEEVAVWYTLSAGSSTSSKDGASFFAASPHDGMDAYYLYSKGNIFYCGAGHSVVTGPDRDNNDERRLFINVIVNSVRNKGAKPKITVHEPDGKGDPIDKSKEDGNIFLNPSGDSDYIYNIDSNEGIPEFDFKVKVDSSTTLKQVYVYYDLNYGTADGDLLNDYVADGKHIMIAEYNTTTTNDDINGGTLKSGNLAEVRYDPDDPSKGKFKNLKLKPEYFTPYAGKYTYIVIKAVDGKGNVAYSRIKINLIPRLFDLT